ncbi:tetratricopeptide repeat protein [Micromonospora matsumotoense]|uniref:tetratricopeptide repeat protein n=1 Tax=Micromonospora matsumotoense TaxID=121616 RepID=UPI0033E497CF
MVGLSFRQRRLLRTQVVLGRLARHPPHRPTRRTVRRIPPRRSRQPPLPRRRLLANGTARKRPRLLPPRRQRQPRGQRPLGGRLQPPRPGPHPRGNRTQQTGHHDEALKQHQLALRLFRRFDDRRCEGLTLAALGDTYHATCQHDAAQFHWQQALQILDPLGDPHAGAVRRLIARAERAT